MSKSLYKPLDEKIHTKLEDFYQGVQDSIHSLLKRYFWKPTLDMYNKKVALLQKTKKLSYKDALIVVLDHLGEVLKESEPEVMYLIEKGGKDIKQSRMTIAGNNFQALIVHALRMNVLHRNLPTLHVLLKQKGHPIAKKYATIQVGNVEQKPDMDIFIYSDKSNTPVIISSCKTSLRERAGQTYRWKLLLDLATANREHLERYKDCPINKYQIKYQGDKKIFVLMITADLYNEISRPQQKGALIFFDRAFITNPKENKLPSNVERLSKIIKYLQEIYQD